MDVLRMDADYSILHTSWLKNSSFEFEIQTKTSDEWNLMLRKWFKTRFAHLSTTSYVPLMLKLALLTR